MKSEMHQVFGSRQGEKTNWIGDIKDVGSHTMLNQEFFVGIPVPISTMVRAPARNLF